MTKLRIRHVRPQDLKPRADNPRLIDERAYGKLKEALGRFGFVEPLVVNTTTGNMVGGHQRQRAALELDIGEVPIVEIAVTEEEERALNVALNNRELQGAFDPAALIDFLAPIEQTPLLEASGFDYDQWQNLQTATRAEALKAGREGATPPLAPEDSPTRTTVGQTIRLGRHLLHVGKAEDPASYTHLPAPADVCFADPPYAIRYEQGLTHIETRRKARRSITRPNLDMVNDGLDPTQFLAWLTTALVQVADHLTGAIYLCHSPRLAPEANAALIDAGYHISTTIAWVKDRFVLGRGDYQSQWEGILYGWRDGHGSDRHWYGGRANANLWEHSTPKKAANGRKGPSDVWRHQRPAASRLHPTMKPVALVEHALRNSSPAGALALDPFAGSGTTLIAAENTARTAYVIELDPRYADIIWTRWESVADDPTDTEIL